MSKNDPELDVARQFRVFVFNPKFLAKLTPLGELSLRGNDGEGNRRKTTDFRSISGGNFYGVEFRLFPQQRPAGRRLCVHTIVELFSAFETFVPWIALALLGYIGGKMLLEGIKGEEAEETAELSAGALFMQGVATSIDALSVGFTISEYGWLMALVCSLIVATVTFFLCEAGLSLGKKFGTKLSGKASILGGVILIGIGLEIFISGVFG